MKKYFIISDVHSFYKEMRTALRKAGFNKRNKEHILIICGDIFDRGPAALDVYNYILSIPKKRRILIKGNHESLYKELLTKNYPEEHDFSNYTVDTFCQIAGVSSLVDDMSTAEYLKSSLYVYYGMFSDTVHIDPEAQEVWNKVREAVKNHEITKWLDSSEWKDYYELDKYIFVHSFIPTVNLDGLPGHYIRNRKLQYMQDWRTKATVLDWEDARWGCPWSQYLSGCFAPEEENGKILVCGHWQTKDFFKQLAFDNSGCRNIFCGKSIIAIDGGVSAFYDPYDNYKVALVHPQNVLVIENNQAFDGNFNNMPLSDMTPQPYTVEETPVFKDNTYWVNPTVDAEAYELSYCAANCATPCARKNNAPAGICTVSDFSESCANFKAKN